MQEGVGSGRGGRGVGGEVYEKTVVRMYDEI